MAFAASRAKNHDAGRPAGVDGVEASAETELQSA